MMHTQLVLDQLSRPDDRRCPIGQARCGGFLTALMDALSPLYAFHSLATYTHIWLNLFILA